MKIIHAFLIVLFALSFMGSSVSAAAQPAVPPGTTITSATLSFYVAAPSGLPTELHRITAAWEENTVTWNSFANSYDPAVITTFTPTVEGWVNLDVTGMVQSWVNGTVPNYGFVMVQPVVSSSAPVLIIRCSEYATVMYRPKLEICHDGVCDTVQRPGSIHEDVYDTYIHSAYPDTNYGDSGCLYVHNKPTNQRDALIRFDLVSNPAVEIVKYTNGVTASDPNGTDVPRIAPGDPIEWTYQVTNTGNTSIPRDQVVVSDDQLSTNPSFKEELTGNGDTIFEPGEVWLYSATGVGVDLTNPPAEVTVTPNACTLGGAEPGRNAYVNTGTVTIPGATASATSSYCNSVTPGISIVKYTNGVTASDPNGTDVPRIAPGQPIEWTYKVTNTGETSVPRNQVVVTDDQLTTNPTFKQEITGNGDTIFEPGEVWLYSATGVGVDLTNPPVGVTVTPNVCTAGGTEPGRNGYVNTGTVTIPGATATAKSSYCNITTVPEPAVSIVKYTNGVSASDPNGTDVPRINPGDSIEWTYKVTNTGNTSIPRAQVVVTDDQLATNPTFKQELAGNGDTTFDPGEVWLYSATGVAVNLTNPPAEVTVTPNVCTAGGAEPGHNGYVNTGTVTIPDATASDTSSYCNIPLSYKYYIPIAYNKDQSTPNTFFQGVLGYEDLPRNGGNDYDYNDWVVDVNGAVVYSGAMIGKLYFNFVPKARGSAYYHAFHFSLDANTFPSSGTATLTLKDQNGSTVSQKTYAFTAGAVNDYTIFANTMDIFPGYRANAIEGRPVEAPTRTAELLIEFSQPFPYVFNPDLFYKPHGADLFFNPYIIVKQTGEVIGRGDIRLLNGPNIPDPFQWAEESVRIDYAYPKVKFLSYNPANIEFPVNWWQTHTNCVFDGVPCVLPGAGAELNKK